MKNKILISLLVVSLLALASCCECEKSKRNSVSVVGKFSWKEWQKSAGWEDYSAPDYAPQKEYVEKIKRALKEKPLKFAVIAGAWCGDSKSEVPKIFKLFKALNLDESQILLYGVDRQKKEPTGFAEKLNVERVPTLVVFSNGKEIGRIVEFPYLSWEEDLATILGVY